MGIHNNVDSTFQHWFCSQSGVSASEAQKYVVGVARYGMHKIKKSITDLNYLYLYKNFYSCILKYVNQNVFQWGISYDVPLCTFFLFLMTNVLQYTGVK